jgi:hypothetical protein
VGPFWGLIYFRLKTILGTEQDSGHLGLKTGFRNP